MREADKQASACLWSMFAADGGAVQLSYICLLGMSQAFETANADACTALWSCAGLDAAKVVVVAGLMPDCQHM